MWLFTAEVDIDVVNVWETVMAQLNPDYGSEVEVQFFKHAQIYVWKAERIEGYNRGYDPSLQESGYSKVVDTVDIDELRRC